VLLVALRCIARFYRTQSGRRAGKTGSVTAIQRFGSALKLNLHFHVVHLDGVYDRGAAPRVLPRLPIDGGHRAADGHADILIASDGLYLFLGAQAPDWRALDQADSAVPEFDRSGCALGVGDVDGDGFDDVAVSGGGDTAWLAYGAASGVDLERGSRPVIEVPEGLGAIIGGGGDVNADGLDDWLVSSPYSDWDDVEGAGVAYLLLGAPR
jgi:hypothetical protein